MKTEVVFAPRARAQAKARATWWITHRDKAPTLFAQELAAAIDLLEHTPLAGVPFQRARRPGVRRYLMVRVDHHLYYAFDERAGEVRVLSVWYARRGREPKL